MMTSTAEIEVNKFASMVSAIGADTLAAISRAGPETQVNGCSFFSALRGVGLRWLVLNFSTAT